MKKKLSGIIFLCVVLALAVAASIASMLNEKNNINAKSETIIKINSLQQERNNLYSRLALFQNERGETDIGGASVFLCFDYADRNLYEIIYPTLSYHGFRGIFTFQPDTAPSDDGLISLEQYNELIGAGWEAAVKYSEDTDIAQTKARFEELGISFPQIMVFDTGQYSADMASTLTDLGITVCITENTDDDGIVKIPSEAVTYSSTSEKLRVNKVINDATSLVLRTGRVMRYVEERNRDCDLEKYEETLRWLKVMQNNKQLLMQNTYDQLTVLDVLNETAVKSIQSNAQIDILNEEIAKLDEEIAALKESVKNL